MKKLAMMALAVLFVTSLNASAWWIFGKKGAEEPAKDEAVAVEKSAGKAGASACEAKKAAKCSTMSAEEKAKCEKKCSTMSAEDKAKCEKKCAKISADDKAKGNADRKAKKAEKKVHKAEKAVEAAVEAAPAAVE